MADEDEMNKVSSDELEEHIADAEYPAKRAALVENAKQHNAPTTERVVMFLEQIPDPDYEFTGPSEVTEMLIDVSGKDYDEEA